VEHDGLSAAILDHAVGNEQSSALYRRLNERGIPFMIYSGYPKIEDVAPGTVHVRKPATHGVLLAAMEGLIKNRATQTETLPATNHAIEVND
jgi:hypothetical protein